MRYRIEYSPVAEDHLRALTARQRSIVFDAVDAQLSHEPSRITRNRKPMQPNPLAPWELRVGDLRIYYDVEDAPAPVVNVRAIGVKEHDRVRIGNVEVDL